MHGASLQVDRESASVMFGLPVYIAGPPRCRLLGLPVTPEQAHGLAARQLPWEIRHHVRGHLTVDMEVTEAEAHAIAAGQDAYNVLWPVVSRDGVEFTFSVVFLPPGLS